MTAPRRWHFATPRVCSQRRILAPSSSASLFLVKLEIQNFIWNTHNLSIVEQRKPLWQVKNKHTHAQVSGAIDGCILTLENAFLVERCVSQAKGSKI